MNGRHLWAVALLVSIAGAGSAADWAQFRGPQSRGSLGQGLPDGEGDLILEKSWIRELGSGYSGVSTQGNVLVTMFADDGEDLVGAFDASSGAEIWRYVLEPTYAGHDGSHDGPISTPLISEGRVFALGAWGRFAALDLATGEEAWSVHLVEDLGAEKPWYGFGSSPIPAGGNVVVGAAGDVGTLIALDPETGELSWRSGTDPIEYQSPVLLELGGREQVVVGARRSIFAVDPANGEAIWSYEHGGGGQRGAASLTVLPVGADRLFIDHDDKSSALLQITSQDGTFTAEKVWEGKALINSYIPPVESGGSLFGYSTRFLTAVDPATGDLLYRSREPGDGFPIVIEDQMVILTKGGTLHVGPAAAEGWSETASMELFGTHSWTLPAYADGSLYLRSFGELARVDLVRGVSAGSTSDIDLPAPIARIATADDPEAAADELWAQSAPPWIEGDRVTFAWRGEAEDVGIGGDMIGVRREEAMKRVEGSDVWWWSTTLPAASRINYAYLVDFEPTLDPGNPRSVQSTLFGPDMNIAQPDSIEMSWLAMPDWQEPSHYQAAPEGHPRGALHELQIPFQPPTREDETEAPEPVEVEVAIWTPPGYDDSDETYPIAYVLDGEARRTGGWVNTLDRLVGERFAPALVAFVDMPRLPPALAQRAFTESVVSTIETGFRVRAERDARALVGHGGSSLGALIIAFSQPDFAGRVAAQSFHAIEVQMTPLNELLASAEGDEPSFDIYLEWGSLDFRAVKEGWDMRRVARELYENLAARGYRLDGGEVVDSTDWASWRNRTDRILEQLFPIDGASGSS